MCEDKVMNTNENLCCDNNTFFDKEIDVDFNCCELIKSCNARINLRNEGRLLNVRVKLRNICRGCTVALGILVCYKGKLKGFKVVEVEPPCNSDCCTNYTVNIPFVLAGINLCKAAQVEVKLIANYSSISSSCNSDCPCDCCCPCDC